MASPRRKSNKLLRRKELYSRYQFSRPLRINFVNLQKVENNAIGRKARLFLKILGWELF